MKRRVRTWLRRRAFHIFLLLIDSEPSLKYVPGDCERCEGSGIHTCQACFGTGWKDRVERF